MRQSVVSNRDLKLLKKHINKKHLFTSFKKNQTIYKFKCMQKWHD